MSLEKKQLLIEERLNELWNHHFPMVMWYRILGLEETLEIKTYNTYRKDASYLRLVDLISTYSGRYGSPKFGKRK